MRTILIADDEPLIVTGLSQKVDWAQMGCQVVGVAQNGLDALHLLEALDPDILLTDIVMPGATGLELAAYVKEKRRRTRIILLSTYDHFDYAREGIRMGVCDYILKPIDLDKLREAVEKAIEKLSAQEHSTSSIPLPAAEQLAGINCLRQPAAVFLPRRPRRSCGPSFPMAWCCA